MKARPILFSTPMVRALLNGHKTQTRRIMKGWFGKEHNLKNLKENGDPDINYSGLESDPLSWGYPYAEDGAADIAIGDKYWSNLFCPYGKPDELLWVRETYQLYDDGTTLYRSTVAGNPPENFIWKPSIFMPRRISRLTLELTNVRVERLQDISRDDAIAEGCSGGYSPSYDFAQHAYKQLWNMINGPGSWDVNPWVWVISFKVHKMNIDEFLKGRMA